MHTEGNAGAAEAEGIEQCLHQAQEAALDETHGGCREIAVYGRCCDGQSKRQSKDGPLLRAGSDMKDSSSARLMGRRRWI